MIKRRLPTIRIQQNKRTITVPILAFYPNLRGGKNSAYLVVSNDAGLEGDNALVRPDESGKFLYVNEAALPISTRLDLHKQSRQMGGKPLVYDERARSVRFVW
jgi:hypothetical protein